MAWLFGGTHEKDEPQDDAVQKGSRLTGKDLEKAQELVKEMLKADREAVERYSIIPPTFPGTK
jgi:hypothetical protein